MQCYRVASFYEKFPDVENNFLYDCLIAAAPTQEVDQSSVSSLLRGGEEEEKDPGEEGQHAPAALIKV